MAIEISRNYWRQKDSNNLFEFDTEKMRKDEYNYKGCRMPVYLEKDEVLLYREGWKDDGESYIISDKKYLKAVKM